jgi:(2R)-3-sulfolactate dehydrogenase (NADP+)
MTEVSLADIERRACEALELHGAGTFQATEVAKAIVRAEALGNVICGLLYLESYCLQLASGRVNGSVEPQIDQSRPGAVTANARFGFAQPAFARALPLALDAARTNGVATLAVANAHTCTSLGYFTEQIGANGLIGIGFANASPVVAPPGGTRPVIGTNPIAMTVPGNDHDLDHPRLHFDSSTSAVALGKISMAKAGGLPIPEGWALDSEGQPTTDPERALNGSLLSSGGYKGWGFGLMAEVFAACLTGSVNSIDVKALKSPVGPPHGLGQYYVLIDPSTHCDDFFDRFHRLATAVAIQDGARLPGTERKVLVSVNVPDSVWSDVIRLSGWRPAGL